MALLRRHPVAQSSGRSLLSTTVQQRRSGAADEVAARQFFGPVELTAAQSTGWLSPTGSSGSWTNLANVYSENGLATTQVVAAEGEGEGLYTFGYPFNIPAGARIKGVQVRVKGRVTTGSLWYSYAFLARHPTFQPNSVTSYSVTLTGSESTVYAGGPDDLWGSVTLDANSTPDRGWAVSDFDASFAVFAAFGASELGATVAIDTVQVNVHYWPALTTGYSNALAATQSYGIETAGAAGSEWTSWLSPVSSTSNNTVPWLDPTNVHARDGAYATVTTSVSDDNSMYSVWNAAGIPAGATLNGIQLRVRGYSSGASSLALYLYNYDDTKVGHIRAVNLGPTLSDRIAGDAVDLFLPMGAGSSFTTEDFNSNGWNVLFGEDTDGISTAVDSIEARFNYSTATTTYLDTPYSNGGTGTQGYAATYGTETTYSQGAAGAQAYWLRYWATSTYASGGVGAQSYATLAALPMSYAASGVGAQAYGASYRVLTPYDNAGSGAQSYLSLRVVPTSYRIDGIGGQSYAAAHRTSSSYLVGAEVEQDYTSALAVLTPYLSQGGGLMTYSSAFRTMTGYGVDGSGAHAYTAQYGTLTPYSNSAIAAQSYASILPGPLTTPYSNLAVGGQSYQPTYRAQLSYGNAAQAAQDYGLRLVLRTAYVNAAVGGHAYAPRYETRSSYAATAEGTHTYTATYRVFSAYAIDGIGAQDYAVTITTFVAMPDRLFVTVEWHDWLTTEGEVRRVKQTASYVVELHSTHELVVPGDVDAVLTVGA